MIQLLPGNHQFKITKRYNHSVYAFVFTTELSPVKVIIWNIVSPVKGTHMLILVRFLKLQKINSKHNQRFTNNYYFTGFYLTICRHI